jgi:RimJ/RimL family protein N-acetyltransferase
MVVINKLEIRPYSENDYSAITKYCLPEEQAIYTSLPIDVIETFKKDNYNQPFVIFFADYLIGCFALNVNRAGNPYTSNENAIVLKSFSIDSHYQNRGYALKTLRLLPEISKLKFPDKDEMILTVHHTNIPARNLYIKAGFMDQGLRFEGEHGEELIFHFDLI